MISTLLPSACQKVFSLLEGYIDFLSNVAFGRNPHATGQHITLFCRTIAPLGGWTKSVRTMMGMTMASAEGTGAW